MTDDDPGPFTPDFQNNRVIIGTMAPFHIFREPALPNFRDGTVPRVTHIFQLPSVPKSVYFVHFSTSFHEYKWSVTFCCLIRSHLPHFYEMTYLGDEPSSLSCPDSRICVVNACFLPKKLSWIVRATWCGFPSRKCGRTKKLKRRHSIVCKSAT